MHPEELMMLDVIGAIVITGLSVTVAAVLVGFSPATAKTKFAVLAAATTWLAIVAAVAVSGGLKPGSLGPVPANLLPFGGLLALLFASWLLVPGVRDALLSVPLAALVGLNAGRVAGIFFLLLYSQDRLSAPFAPAAGLGDIAAGAAAIPLAAMLALGFKPRRAWIHLWNAFGALDLVVAVSLALLSAPGTPFRLFTDGPGTEAMTTLPWAFVPAALVPVFLLIHLTIAAKLRTIAHAPRLAVA
jgi:hypothetical protein